MGFKLLRKKGPGKNLFTINSAADTRRISHNTAGLFTSQITIDESNYVATFSGTSRKSLMSPTVSGARSYAAFTKSSEFDTIAIGWFGATDSYMTYDVSDIDNGTQFVVSFELVQAQVSGINGSFKDIQIEKGSSVTPYEPYMNYIYKGLLTNENDGKRGKVDLGTLTWSYDATNTRFMSSKVNDMLPNRENGYLDGYSTLNTAPSASSKDKTFCLYAYGTNNPVVFVKDTRFTTAAAFKAAMSGKYLYYQRTTDTEWVPPRWSMLYKKEATE